MAELTPPSATGTSWDFSTIDPQIIPFLDATNGREPVIDFSVIPRWMFKINSTVDVPADPDKLVWNYSNISGVPFLPGPNPVALTDPTGKQVGDYYARLVSWYTQGGFTDERGVYHKSGYRYSFPWWEVLSELDNGEDIKLYDSIVSAIQKVSPETKFQGFSEMCSFSYPNCSPEDIEYFLDPKNHAPGVPLDRLSYHTYALPTKAQTPDDWQYSFFDQADGFLDKVKYVDEMRRRLRPSAGVDINEVGCILPQDMADISNGLQGKPPVKSEILSVYWNACGAYYAYMFIGLAREGVDVVKASQLLGYPGQFASVSLLNADNGLPNARYRVLELIVNKFRPGDQFVQTGVGTGSIDDDVASVGAQALITSRGKKLLLINKRNRSISLQIKSGINISSIEVVDQQTAGESLRRDAVREGRITLAPFAVAVANFD